MDRRTLAFLLLAALGLILLSRKRVTCPTCRGYGAPPTPDGHALLCQTCGVSATPDLPLAQPPFEPFPAAD